MNKRVDKSSKLESRDFCILNKCSVDPLAEALDVAKDDIKHCIFTNAAVEILLAVVVSNDSLISRLVYFQILDSSRLNSVA